MNSSTVLPFLKFCSEILMGSEDAVYRATAVVLNRVRNPPRMPAVIAIAVFSSMYSVWKLYI
jgi:hypothetical protein